MTDRLTFGFLRGGFLPQLGGLAVLVSLQACTSTGFVDEGSEKKVEEDNLAKSMMIAAGAIDDPNAKPIQYNPRAPLVVPPKRTLPTPVDADAKLANSKFPVNPEDADEKRRLAVQEDKTGTRVMTPDEQARFKNLPKAGPDSPDIGANRDTAAPLKPWELDGTAHRQALAEAEKRDPARRKDSLIAPPESYRTPSPKAPMQADESTSIKPSWWPF